MILGSSALAYAAHTDKINPSQENPDPIICPSENRNYEQLGDNPALYDDYAWYITAPDTDYAFARKNNLWGIWLPEGPPAFRPFIADPRQVTLSVGWRFNDKTLGKNLIPVTLGGNFPIFRWVDIWPMRGDVQFEIEGAVWAIFDPLHASSPLIDADYYIGFPITYLFGNWAVRLRGYHISTHIGDEYLLDHPHFSRKNPSIEAFDLYASYQFTHDIRLYGGIGWVACQDDSYRVGPFYAQAGAEIRLFQIGYKDYCNRFYGVPFLAMDFYYHSHFKHHVNSNFAIGYEWGKVSGIRRKMRIMLEYHDGYSLEGQFSKFPTHYLAIRATYGF